MVVVGAAPVPLFAPLCADGRELVLVELASEAGSLRELATALERVRDELGQEGVAARIACFTSAEPLDDALRVAAEQSAELLVLDRGLGELPEAPQCDVVVVARPEPAFVMGAPVVVPFGGGADEWAALQLAAWLARAHGLPLRLVGAEEREGRRDASRLLASASLALQRFAGSSAEPVLAAPGAEGILAQPASLLVIALPTGELGETRQTLVERADVPVLLVRGGLRPGGLAPDRTLTRFSWSLRDG